MGRVINMANDFFYIFQGFKRKDIYSPYDYFHMMKYRVKMGEPQYIRDWIESLDISKHPSVIKIQNDLLDMFNNPAKHTCLSKDDRDNIFKPKGKDWASGPTGGAYGFNKCTIRCIKENMFAENPNCPELAGGEEW